MAKQKVCVIIGVGPGNGAAYARKFAREGYVIALLSRTTEFGEGLLPDLTEGSRALPCDASDPAAIERCLATIEADMGPVDVLLYNAGSGGGWGSPEETTMEQFELGWRVNAQGLLKAAQSVAPAMKTKGAGAIIITGATASRRGGARTTGFAASKAAQRSLAESLAKHFWPMGIHVALIILDGVVDLPRTRERMADKPDDFFVKADDVADLAWSLAQQPRSAWSFEAEARPFGEKW